MKVKGSKRNIASDWQRVRRNCNSHRIRCWTKTSDSGQTTKRGRKKRIWGYYRLNEVNSAIFLIKGIFLSSWGTHICLILFNVQKKRSATRDVMVHSFKDIMGHIVAPEPF